MGQGGGGRRTGCGMSIAGGTVRKRKWSHEGRKRSTWGWTLNVDGKQVRRQGFASSEEAQTVPRDRRVMPPLPNGQPQEWPGCQPPPCR